MSDEHIDVGAYALGLLEDEDSTAFEAHLARCPSCHAELAEFTPMKALLTGLGPVEDRGRCGRPAQQAGRGQPAPGPVDGRGGRGRVRGGARRRARGRIRGRAE